MTNIYNKKVLVKNGTLIGNWFEEEILREVSGEGRTIPGKHIPKHHLVFDEPIIHNFTFNDTNLRIIGTKQETPYGVTSDNYGDFSCPENKYKKITINDKIFHQFFKTFIRNDGSEKAKMEENLKTLKNLEIYKSRENTQSFAEAPQSFDNSIKSNIKDFDPINNKTQSLVQKQIQGGKSNSIQSNDSNVAFANSIDKYIPYYLEKENNYWSNTLEKNIYNNLPKSKINTFVNPIKINEVKNLKTTSSLLEIITPKVNSKFGHFDEYKNEAFEYKKNLQSASAFYNTQDFFSLIKQKIIVECMKRGWVGVRKLRIFLKNLTKGKNNGIEKVNFKYFFANYGIVFDDKEIDYIFNTFENQKKDEINFNEFLDNFTLIPESRLRLVLEFFNKLKNNKNLIEYKNLEKILNSEIHPEVVSFRKTVAEIKIDVSSTWDNLRIDKDKLISQENFVYYFRDISTCIPDDKEFHDILNSLGFYADK